MARTAGVSAALATVLGAFVVLAAVGTIGVATGGVAAQVTNETNVTQHENPESVAEQGDSARLRSWLSDRLIEEISESSIRLSQGQYEQADDVFDEEYEHRLDQYVDVAGETDGVAGGDGGDGRDGGVGGGDSEEQTAFDQVRDQQTRLATLRGEYATTYKAYLAAREAGNQEEARLLARRLAELETRIRLVAGNLTQTLQTIKNETGRDTSDIVQRLRNEVENVTETQQDVQNATFRETILAVTANRTRASFVDPVRLRGRLVTDNGTAVANRLIQVRVGHQLYVSTTGPNGTFTMTYRPAFVSVGDINISVQYLPNATTPYLGTASNVSLAVKRTDPMLLASRSEPVMSLSVNPVRARYRETLAVETDLTVNGRPVVDVPVTVTIGPRTITETRTARNGIAQTVERVSAGLPPGELAVRSRVVGENLAVGSINATAAVTIPETKTAVTVETKVSAAGVVVAGRLVGFTDDNQAFGVPSQPVVVRVGETTRTIRTDASGNYQTVVSPGALNVAEDRDSIQVRTQFDGNGTNLESASAQARMNASAIAALTGSSDTTDESGDAADGSGDALGPGWRLVGAAVFVIGVAVFGWWRRRRAEKTATDDTEAVVLTDDGLASVESRETGPLADAQDALAAGAPDRAVIAAYATTRASLSDRFGLDESYTPRELLAACERHLDSEGQRRLQRLTEIYERTVFAPESTEGVGQDAIAAARSLLTSGTSSDPADPADD